MPLPDRACRFLRSFEFHVRLCRDPDMSMVTIIDRETEDIHLRNESCTCTRLEVQSAESRCVPKDGDIRVNAHVRAHSHDGTCQSSLLDLNHMLTPHVSVCEVTLPSR